MTENVSENPPSPFLIVTGSGKELSIGELFLGVSSTHTSIADDDAHVAVVQLEKHPALEGGKEFQLKLQTGPGKFEQITIDNTWTAVMCRFKDGTIGYNVMPSDTSDLLHRFSYALAANRPLGIEFLSAEDQVTLAALRDEPDSLRRFWKISEFFWQRETAQRRGDDALLISGVREAENEEITRARMMMNDALRILYEQPLYREPKEPPTGNLSPSGTEAIKNLNAQLAAKAAATAPQA